MGESPVPFRDDFWVKNEDIGPENTYFLNVILKKANR